MLKTLEAGDGISISEQADKLVLAAVVDVSALEASIASNTAALASKQETLSVTAPSGLAANTLSLDVAVLSIPPDSSAGVSANAAAITLLQSGKEDALAFESPLIRQGDTISITLPPRPLERGGQQHCDNRPSTG